MEEAAREAMASDALHVPQRWPVWIHLRTYIDSGQARDYNGEAASEEHAADALVNVGLLPDDTREYDRGCTLRVPEEAETTYTGIIIDEGA